MCTCPLSGKHWRLELAHFSRCCSISLPPSVDRLLEDMATNCSQHFPACQAPAVTPNPHHPPPAPAQALGLVSPVFSLSCSSPGGGIFSSHNGTLAGESGPQPALVKNCCEREGLLRDEAQDQPFTLLCFHVLSEKRDEAVSVWNRTGVLTLRGGRGFVLEGRFSAHQFREPARKAAGLRQAFRWERKTGRVWSILPGAELTVH